MYTLTHQVKQPITLHVQLFHYINDWAKTNHHATISNSVVFFPRFCDNIFATHVQGNGWPYRRQNTVYYFKHKFLHRNL